MTKEAFRMQVVALARVFKRSWVDMAEALVRVRNQDLHHAWGYETLHGYALEELNVKRSTVDKLTGSYHAMERHVPQALEWDGVAKSMPTMEAVDYFARAVDPKPKREGDPAPDPPDEEVVGELKTAIFEDLASPATARRRFGEVLDPKTDEQRRLQILGRLRTTANRLESLVTHVEELSPQRVREVTDCMETLRSELDELTAESS